MNFAQVCYMLLITLAAVNGYRLALPEKTHYLDDGRVFRFVEGFLAVMLIALAVGLLSVCFFLLGQAV